VAKTPIAMKRSEKLFNEARKSIPGGVNSPVRAWRAVGGTPRFISRGQGARITDVEGRSYVDFVGSWGPLILGHAHPHVLRAVRDAAERGLTFGAPTPGEVELARDILAAFPSIEKVRLVSSGTEATMSAIRVARGFTRRPGILKFAGAYHGHSDALLVRAGSGAATFGVPDSEGVPESVTAHTRVAEFNDVAAVEAFLRGREIAAVIVEPIVGNMGVVLPKTGFLEALRKLTRRYGTLLVFDEVITGFRVAKGGVQELSGISADLTCLGKVLGGGMPLGAFGGRSDVMDHLSPVGGVYQAGTLSGNPVAVAAGLATIAELGPKSYARLEALGSHLEERLKKVLRDRRIRAAFNRVGSMWTLFFGVDAVSNFTQAKTADVKHYARFFHGMLERGFYLPPSQLEAAFVSLAHTEAEIDEAAMAASEALAAK
jgi:glutamate-1-semialdehyde 2,1-aminomutase